MLGLVLNNEGHWSGLTGISQATLDWADSHLGFFWKSWFSFRSFLNWKLNSEDTNKLGME